jgi:hypothetical protein
MRKFSRKLFGTARTKKLQRATTEKEYYRQTLLDAHWMIPQADFPQLFTKIYAADA